MGADLHDARAVFDDDALVRLEGPRGVLDYEVIRLVEVLVFRGFGKLQRQDAEVHEIRAVDAGERFGEHEPDAQDHGRQGCVLDLNELVDADPGFVLGFAQHINEPGKIVVAGVGLEGGDDVTPLT